MVSSSIINWFLYSYLQINKYIPNKYISICNNYIYSEYTNVII